MAVESAVNNSVLKELVEPAITRPTARIPLITVVNPYRRAITLASRGVRIAMLEPPNAYTRKLHMRTHECRIYPMGVPPKARVCTHGSILCVRMGSRNVLLGFVAILSFLSLSPATSALNLDIRSENRFTLDIVESKRNLF
ncbi:hypothetical protein PIB30_009422 [Stylosanthes scabra]|uniref:Uncharacterized protein n=1 Tax=Stylosanthes scabra TaxID=79078 RepID=A0ABU6W4T9_9FABA|nr:hypothetical protein [Stylosanthes scabra]